MLKKRLIMLGFLLTGIAAAAQQLPPADKEQLPPASLWERYSHRLQFDGGIEPYHWRIASGSFPPGMELQEDGDVMGIPEDAGTFELTVLIRDSNNPPKETRKKFVFSVETPITADWDHTTRVNGQRIDGSIKVSNKTGRDFDVTVVVLAVNEIGRATAIGYQHFPLIKQTRDLNIPFGDTVSRGAYVVNVDVVGEEPVSNRIFRARLVTEHHQVTQGP
jgi:hypothetical protein